MRFHGIKPLSAAVALLWLYAPVASVLHGALSPHVHHYCDEHAAFEEGPSRDGADGDTTVASPAPDPRDGEGQRTPDHHESCTLANFGHLAKNLRIDGRLPVVGLRAESCGLLVAPLDSFAVSAAPLTVAPKTDPPRA